MACLEASLSLSAGESKVSHRSADARLTAVAMSGGVDSSTAAAILHEQGEKVVGLTMQLWNQRRLPEPRGEGPVQHRCCSLDDVYDARRVAEHLGFPFYVVNFERHFEEAVVLPFVESYLAGRTPVPCTLCNNQLKFGELLLTARQIGAEYIATGHYARVRRNKGTGRYELLRAKDGSKDQSYFLFGLTQEQLSRTLFPLGEMSKEEVRAFARRAGLPVAEKPESQEICFVPTGDYVRFIESYLEEQERGLRDETGEIVTTDGEFMGRHHGLHRYTVGQRRGLGVATGRPLYVVAVDRERNQLIVGEDGALRQPECTVRGVNWVSIAPAVAPLRAQVKIRHRHEAAEAVITPLAEAAVRLCFDEPQRAITPGQAAVFYEGERLLGGGWIESSNSES